MTAMKNPQAYRVYLIMRATQALASAIMFTTLIMYYVTMVGMNPLQLVLVGTVLESTYFLFEVPTGVVADTTSRRLSVIIGMFVLGAAYLFQGLIPLFAAVLLAEAIRGVGETFLSGATEAWLADEIGDENVGTAFLRSGQVNRIAGVAGTIGSVALASIAFNLPLLVGGGLYLALGVFLMLKMPETGFVPTPREGRNSSQSMRRTFWEGVRVVRRSPVLLNILGIGFFFGAASEGIDRLGEAHLLANFAFPALGALQLVVWFGIISIVGSLIDLAVTEVFRQRLEAISKAPAATARALLGFYGLMIAGAVMFGLAGSFTLALAALLAYGMFRSLGGPLYDAWLIQSIDSKVRATVLSMSGQANAIGQIAGGPGIGLIGNVFSIRAAIVATGLLLSPALPLIARTLRRDRRAPEAGIQAEPALAESIEAT